MSRSDDLLDALIDLLVTARYGTRRPAVRFRWRAKVVGGKTLPLWQQEDGQMAGVLRIDQKVRLTVQPEDAYGNPARVDGIPEWGISDPTLATLVVDPDGLSVEVTPTGSAQPVQLNVTGDADLGAGVRPIIGTLDLQLEPGEATFMRIIMGVPEPK